MEIKVGMTGKIGDTEVEIVSEYEWNHVPVFVAVSIDGMHIWRVTRSGGCIITNEKFIPKPPYADFKIDDPVMVKNNSDPSWFKRYFAGVDCYGCPLTFSDAGTSWTSNRTIIWSQCRRPTEEELNSK